MQKFVNTSPLQSAKPASQAPIAHAPALQSGVAWGVVHVWAQAPQFWTSEARSALSYSQPFMAWPSQSLRPAAQPLASHAPPEQISPDAQALPHAPQFLASTEKPWVSYSQPSCASPSQSAKPALQAPSAHAPVLQSGVALKNEHATLQPPQFSGSFGA